MSSGVSHTWGRGWVVRVNDVGCCTYVSLDEMEWDGKIRAVAGQQTRIS